MISKRIATGCIAASLAFTPAAPALADAGDAIVGGIIGGIIGGAIVNESNKKRNTATTTTQTSSRSTISSAQREQNREVQVSLNYFGFPVGTPDGSLGPKSRAAISEYQAMLGYAPTGQLTEYERTLLVGSYHRGMAGGALTTQQAAANPMGMRGLLKTWRDEAAAGAAGTLAAAPVPEAATPLPVIAGAGGELPSFMGGAATVSLASHCNQVSLMTATNGGFTTVATMTDPAQALNEQFCLSRTYAISQGEGLAAKITGFTAQQIADQCAGFGPAMQAHVAALSTSPSETVLGGVRSFAATTGMAPGQLSGTAKICLSVGYRTDALDVAIGSGLLLVALGEGVYGELLGHHLVQGIGAAQRSDLALEWFEIGFDALDAGAMPVFAPGQPERLNLLRKAAFTAAGRADQAGLDAAVPAALPGFTILPADPDEGEAVFADAPATQNPTAETTLAGADAETAPGASKIGALPMAARLPFLLFRN